MKRFIHCLGALAMLSVAAPGIANPPAPNTSAAEAPSAEAPFGQNNRVQPVELATVTGREDTAMSIRATNTGNVSNNSVVGHSQTGAVTFDGGAFGNFAGLSLLSANSGNNVSINSSMNVNVAIRP